jgi:hypothetical protein
VYDYSSLISRCEAREEEEKSQGIDTGAMMLRRLSPRLERDFFPKFQELGWQFSRRLKSISTVDDFDSYHHEFVSAFRDTIKARSGTVVSYGEAQQPINIFLKDYTENARLTAVSGASRLNGWLHATLDGVIIYYFQSFFREDFLEHIGPYQAACGGFDAGRSAPFHRRDTSHSQLTQLMFFGRDTYHAWQSWFRQIFPARPALLDAVWSIARQDLFAEGPYWTMPQTRDENSWRGKIIRFLSAGPDEML